MPFPHVEDLEVLARYVAGECAPAEARTIEARLAGSSELRAAADGLRRLIAERRRALHDNSIDAVAALAEVRARVEERAERPRRIGDRTVPAPAIWTWLGRRNAARAAAVAAAVVLVLAGGWGLIHTAARSRDVAHATVGADYVTRRGELRRFTLADGTRVTLGADSRLHVARFSAAGRVVDVAGEAYFEVAPDPSRPFHVRTARIETTVLGTEFGVKAYPKDTVAAVVVREGKVAVTVPGMPVRRAVLTRGMRAQLAGAHMRVVGVDPAAYLAWAHGELSFVDQPADEILKSLERWYDVRIEADPQLRDRRVEVSFANTSFDRGLEALAVALHARVVHVNDLYLLQAVAQ